MRIVAITAVHQTFIDLVVEGHMELRLNLSVAAIAELRLRGLEEVRLVHLAGVDAVAADAAHIAFSVGRTLKIGMLTLVTVETLVIDILGRGLGKAKYLRYIAAAIDVGFAWTMTALASHAFATMGQSQLAVRIICKCFSYI